MVLARVVESVRDPMFSRQIMVNPLEPFSKAACSLGVSLLTPDPDGVVRHFHLSLAGQKTLAEEAVRLLKPELALPSQGLIRYTGPPNHLDTLSFFQVLDFAGPLPKALTIP